VTTFRHTEFRKYEKPGSKQKLVDIMSYVSFFTKNVFTYLFTKKEYITAQLASTLQRQ